MQWSALSHSSPPPNSIYLYTFFSFLIWIFYVQNVISKVYNGTQLCRNVMHAKSMQSPAMLLPESI